MLHSASLGEVSSYLDVLQKAHADAAAHLDVTHAHESDAIGHQIMEGESTITVRNVNNSSGSCAHTGRIRRIVDLPGQGSSQGSLG